MTGIAARAKRLVPVSAKDAVKRMLGRTPPTAEFHGVATTVDLYVWLVGGSMDTIVPLHNWYSVFFPTHQTDTVATVTVLDERGEQLASTRVDVPALAAPTVSVAGLLAEHGITTDGPLRCGAITWHLEAPADLHEHVLDGGKRFLFWDRSYIGYRGAGDHISWVHGVDKHAVVGAGSSTVPWPLTPGPFTSSPEIPVDLRSCERFDVIVQNRDSRERHPTLVVSDARGSSIELTSTVAARGVHRFSLSGACDELDTSTPLRLRVNDLPTRYGRPIVLRGFTGGTFSLMHC